MTLLPAPLPALIRWDEALFKLINAGHAGLFDAVFWSLSTFGSGWGIIPAYALLVFLTAGRRRIWLIVAASAVTLIAGGILSAVMKEHVDRDRPTVRFRESAPSPLPAAAAPEGIASDAAAQSAQVEAGRPFAVHNIGPRLRDHSFPSGHTWTAFAIATLMTLFFGRRYRWAYLAAAAIGYSRIYVGVHFPLDVLGGACCGTLLAFLVWRIAAWIAPGRARFDSTAA